MTKTAALKNLFNIFDENKNNQLTKEEVFNNIIMLSGGTPEEKIKAVFIIYDIQGDGLITYQNVLEHQRYALEILFLLNPNVKRIKQSPESLALATTESIFQDINHEEQLISEAEYFAWYNNEAVSQENLLEKEAKLKSRREKKEKVIEELKNTYKRLTSKENLNEIQSIKETTGLGNVPVHYALRVFKQKNNSGYFSRQQFSDIIIDLITRFNTKFKANSDFYSMIYKLFTKFDRDNNGVMDTSELFCGLSIICAGNLGDKIAAVCDSFDESGDGLMQFAEVLQYFIVVFKVLYSEESHNINIEEISMKSAENLFESYNLSKESAISHEQLKKWILKARIKIC